jgi:hypothetical protein
MQCVSLAILTKLSQNFKFCQKLCLQSFYEASTAMCFAFLESSCARVPYKDALTEGRHMNF